MASTSMRRKDSDGKPTPLSAASINRPLALLRHLLRLAHEEWGVLVQVPRIKLEREPGGRIKWRRPMRRRASWEPETQQVTRVPRKW